MANVIIFDDEVYNDHTYHLVFHINTGHWCGYVTLNKKYVYNCYNAYIHEDITKTVMHGIIDIGDIDCIGGITYDTANVMGYDSRHMPTLMDIEYMKECGASDRALSQATDHNNIALRGVRDGRYDANMCFVFDKSAAIAECRKIIDQLITMGD